MFPAEAGICEPQVGGEFLTTVHVRVAVDDPLVMVATSVLLPALSDELSVFRNAEVSPASVEPLRAQEIVQLASFAIAPNVVDVEPVLATRTVAVEGKLERIEQDGETVVVQAQFVES